jgi:exopolysaccharide biosynthesis polyprenyl glycosylphosphotransferase
VVVGAGQIGRRAARRLIEDPELGLRPVAFMDDEPLDGDPLTEGLPVFPLETDLADLMSSYRVSHVIIAFSRAGHDDLLRIGRRAWELGLTLSVVPRLFEIEGERSSTEHLGGLPLIQFRHSDPHGWQFRVKYATDRLVSGIALLFLSPILAAAALAVLVSLGRPILFRQPRVGLDGREFDMLKFRTLAGAAGEADAAWAASQVGAQAAAQLPAHVPMQGRITRAGAVLRRYCIDELPQLFNVLRGDMSLIGPRPERTTYVQQFGPQIYRYAERHRVKSGLTGWAQVHGLRGSTSLADRVEWDNHYIENWTLWMDVKIALRTVPAVFRGTWTAVDSTDPTECTAQSN